jgi:hypothetical protein
MSKIIDPKLNTLENFFSRERKREREREDLWRKLDDLSLTNAKKEGISLDMLNHADLNSSSGNSA